MNKKYLFIGFVILLFPIMVSGVLTDGLQTYYAFDDCSGTIAVDSNVANQLNATLPSLLWTTGKLGACAVENNGTSQITVGYHSKNSVPVNGNFTWSAWIMRTNAFGSNDVAISTYNGGAPYIQMLSRNAGGENQGFIAELQSSVGYANTNTALTLSTWYHVVMMRDGLRTLIYENGTLKENNTATTASLYTSGTLRIFGHSAGDVMRGRVDEVGIWNRALSASEVTQLYNGGAGYNPYNVDTYSIKGTVLDNSTPIVGATVLILESSTNSSWLLETNSSGRFIKSDLTNTGMYLVTSWLMSNFSFQPVSHWVNVSVAN